MSDFYYLENNNSLQGKIFFDKSLKNLTWLKVGGKANAYTYQKIKETWRYF